MQSFLPIRVVDDDDLWILGEKQKPQFICYLCGKREEQMKITDQKKKRKKVKGFTINYIRSEKKGEERRKRKVSFLSRLDLSFIDN